MDSNLTVDENVSDQENISEEIPRDETTELLQMRTFSRSDVSQIISTCTKILVWGKIYPPGISGVR